MVVKQGGAATCGLPLLLLLPVACPPAEATDCMSVAFENNVTQNRRGQRLWFSTKSGRSPVKFQG